MKGRITIVGLGCVGTSIGLALREQEPDLEIIGHDVESSHARQAHRKGAVNRSDWNLPSACEGADLVILALHLPAVRETLRVIGPHLKDGCVLTDTATVKTPVLEWAREFLPDHVRFISGTPIPGPTASERQFLQGPDAASLDLFVEGLYCITPAPDTDPDAVTTLVGLAKTLEAHPLFLDPTEFDGLQAGVGDLPALVATALLRATVDSPGWKDMRKVAGYEFAALTEPAVHDAAALQERAAANRDNLLRRLDMLVEELRQVRQWLAEGDHETLLKACVEAAKAREQWLKERAAAKWEEAPPSAEIPTTQEQIGRFLFGGLTRRRFPEEEG